MEREESWEEARARAKKKKGKAKKIIFPSAFRGKFKIEKNLRLSHFSVLSLAHSLIVRILAVAESFVSMEFNLVAGCCLSSSGVFIALRKINID